MPSYDHFAPHFDSWQRAFGPAYDELILDRLLALLARHAPRARRLVDLGVGTGDLVLALARRGWEVTGVDRSAAMLAVTRAKLDAAGLAVTPALLAQDLRRLALPAPVDAAICVYTVMNQLVDDGDLALACGAVRAALSPGGIFVFELNLPAAYDRFWSGEERVALPDGTTVDRTHRTLPGRSVIVAEVVIHTAAGALLRDTIEQRPYADAEVEAALVTAGLRSLERQTFNPFTVDEAPMKVLWVVQRG